MQQQIQQQISLYHSLFYINLGICILGFLLSVAFFIKFDIPYIFNVRTGRSVKRAVQRMEVLNEDAGCCHGCTESLVPDFVPVSAQEAEITEILEVQAYRQISSESVSEEVDESFGMFRVEKSVLFVHTDEKI